MVMNQELRGWFFTNEALADFLWRLPDQNKIKRVFGIVGSGDFAFNLLSQTINIEQMVLCDLRLKSCLTVRLKRLFFKTLSRSEVVSFLFNKTVLKKFKKSDFWYKDSFLSHNHLTEYIPYLLLDDRFNKLQNNLSKLEIIPGDFLAVIKNFPDGYFDLIYVSNIFDSQSYFQPTNEETVLIKNKLSASGRLLVVAQDTEKEITKKTILAGFSLQASEIHHFNFWRALWRYDYSFLLFKKVD